MNSIYETRTKSNYKLIVAVSKNNGIGINGKMPWYIKNDMIYFGKMTKNTIDNCKKNAVIMGRNTWESLPSMYSPLPDRDNFIISSTLNIDTLFNDNYRIKTFPSINDVIKYCDNNASCYETLWVIGGSTIYKQFLEEKILSKCYITRINKDYSCDAFFEPLDENEWSMLTQEIIKTDDNIELGFQVFDSLYWADNI